MIRQKLWLADACCPCRVLGQHSSLRAMLRFDPMAGPSPARRQLDNSQETEKKVVMMNPYWIVGFIDAEGHFMVTKTSSGRRRLVFSISQHKKDIQIFKKLQDYFKCGYVICNGSQINVFEYRIASAKSIINNLVPFLDNSKLQTKKGLEYLDFRKIAYLIKHLPKDSAAKLRRSQELDQLIAGLQASTREKISC